MAGEHAFWRLRFAASQGGTYTQIAELAFLAEDGQTLLSTGGTGSASSSYGSGWAASRAFDGNTGTQWCSAAGGWPHWLAYAFASPVIVGAIRLRCGMDGANLPRHSLDLSLQHSDDGTVWSDGGDAGLLCDGSFTANAQLLMAVVRPAPLLQTAPHALQRLTSPNTDLTSLPSIHTRQYRGLFSGCRNIHFGGNGQISGTVKEKGQPDQPLVRQVLLYSENTHTLVASTWSEADGTYRFDRLDREQRYTVISTDYRQLYRAVIADNLKPELMP